jgi:DNA-binding transcriptional MerR regulator
MSREMGFSLPFIAEYLPRFKTGKLSVQDMMDAILARVAEIDQLISEQQVLRQKLMDHIGWFKAQPRRNP